MKMLHLITAYHTSFRAENPHQDIKIKIKRPNTPKINISVKQGHPSSLHTVATLNKSAISSVPN